MKVAVSGKGGVGKTLIAASLAYFLAKKGYKTIAIDADPSPNLALTLGLHPEEARKIVPISENKELVESKTSTGYSGVYRLTFTVDDIVRDYSVRTPLGVNLIVMGTVRSMGSGCTCPANAVVRSLLRHLVVERGEAVVLDMEAGVEHMGRGTAQHVDNMLVVVNANMKSLETAKSIHELGVKAGMGQISLVGNKIENEVQKGVVEKFALENGLKVLGYVPFDPKVVEAEMRGETPLKYEGSEALKAIEKLCERLMLGNA
ncbi:MAG: P-loop NTPase [Nitrososphaerota archaeon]|nr:P-loop NTPase [Candidatus Bathyarchaeota archaeon]MDW8023488.1 P-loop NTPase [Nitrososphaerota archaeon]